MCVCVDSSGCVTGRRAQVKNAVCGVLTPAYSVGTGAVGVNARLAPTCFIRVSNVHAERI